MSSVTNIQTGTMLEAIKEAAKSTSDINKVIELIEKMQAKLENKKEEPTVPSK